MNNYLVEDVIRGNSENIYRKLLSMEKKRRHIPNRRLVFVGMHNVAQYYWCGMYSVYKSRRNEWEMFGVYLCDRLRNAVQLGLFGISSKLSNVLGKLENMKMPKTKKIGCWHFKWRNYVLIGAPDGIDPKYVYEEKVVNSYRFIRDNRPIAFTQADLYGMFFKRKIKKVKMYFREEDRVEEWREKVDVTRANEVLEKFLNTDLGKLRYAPKAYKCKSCEFKRECVIKCE